MAALTPQNEIYLASQYRHALEKQSLELIAGTLDDGEYPIRAAKRELHEEAGISAKNWQHIAHWHMSSNMGALIDVYLATDLTIGQPHQDDEENIKIIKLPFNEAVTKVLSGEIDIAPHAAAILLLALQVLYLFHSHQHLLLLLNVGRWDD